MFDYLTRKFSSIFSVLSSTKRFDENTVEQLLNNIKDALLSADVPYDLVQEFAAQIKAETLNKKVALHQKPSEQLLTIVYKKMVSFLGGEQKVFMPQLPSVITVIGLQGAGKTTTIGKLAFYSAKEAKKQNRSPKIIAASIDYQRPAAIEQLERVAQKAGISFYRAESTDPIQAASEIRDYVRKNKYDLLFLDTAGRLHIDNELLTQLRTINAIVQPTHTILVLDAMTGQESLAVAQAFEQGVGFDGAILSKSDSDARGGAAFAFRYALQKPILFVGTGEKIEDLAPFYAERAASQMLGMGDMQSLAEKASEKIKEPEQQAVYDSWQRGELTLNDFAQQMAMVNRLGSLSSLMKYMPGMGGSLSDTAIEQGQREMNQFRVIIASMTPKERIYPHILNNSRKKRIAKGAGVRVAEVDKLLARFVNMQQYAKLIKKSGGMRNFFK